MIFYVDAAWSYGRAATASDEAAFSSAFRPADESVCVWIPENRPGVLRISIDVEAGDYASEDALNGALAELRTLDIAPGVSPKPVELVAVTSDGLARWTE